MNKLLKYLRDTTGNDLTNNDVKGLNPLILAYVGDTVYDLFVRTYLVLNYHVSVHNLHLKAIEFVNAGAQAKTLHRIEKFLNEEERNIVRRGRNAKSGTIPRNADVGEYRTATGFETLFGYLYLTGQDQRILELVGCILNI